MEALFSLLRFADGIAAHIRASAGAAERAADGEYSAKTCHFGLNVGQMLNLQRTPFDGR